MKNTNWRPFVMFGLMIGFMLVIGLGIVFLGVSRGGGFGPEPTYGNWWPGMWGMGPLWLIFPCFGLVTMLCMMFFFFRMMTGGGGPMSGMMGHTRDPQSRSQVSQDEPHGPQSRSQVPRDEPQDTCNSCGAPIQADWKVCPHCGQELV